MPNPASFPGLREIIGGHHLRQGLNSTGSTISRGLGVTGHEGAISLPAATTNPRFGVLRYDTEDGTMGTIQTGGKAIAVSGSALAAGAKVMCNTSGKFVAHTSGNTPWGTVVSAVSAADTEFELELDVVILQA